jgi:uncharacterized membrane protein
VVTEQTGRTDYESQALSRTEYVTAVVHLYRGELYRANAWRLRLDTTTNWAILTTAGLLSYSFSSTGHSHWSLLVGFLLVSALLGYEARRFRFFDVWRARVRKIEENFYGPILRRDPVSPDEAWGQRVAADLLNPQFKISLLSALRARFTRNYWVIYAVLLLAWSLKIVLNPVEAHSWADLRENLQTGPIAWWIPVLLAGLLLSAILALFFFAPRAPRTEEAYWGPGGDTEDLSLLDV